jgi:hypothetical protein
MDAEIARMDAHLKWLRQDAVAELEAELDGETNPYHREFLLKQLAWFQARLASAER